MTFLWKYGQKESLQQQWPHVDGVEDSVTARGHQDGMSSRILHAQSGAWAAGLAAGIHPGMCPAHQELSFTESISCGKNRCACIT